MNVIAATFSLFISQSGGLALLLFAVGVVLVVAEVLLPTQGILGVLGGLSIVGGVIACFVVNPWLGLVVMLAIVLAIPFAWSAFVKLWPKTLVGRRMVLTEVAGRVSSDCTISVGQTGTTVSELRPIGECDFDGARVEAISEQGLIAPGARVKVVALSDRRPVVQTMEAV